MLGSEEDGMQIATWRAEESEHAVHTGRPRVGMENRVHTDCNRSWYWLHYRNVVDALGHIGRPHTGSRQGESEKHATCGMIR